MTTIALDQSDLRIGETLKNQRREDPILLMEGTDAVGLLLKLPPGMKDSDVDSVYWLDEPAGRVLVILARPTAESESLPQPAQAVFGGCQGMLEVLSEDDEHLQDFSEYMK